MTPSRSLSADFPQGHPHADRLLGSRSQDRRNVRPLETEILHYYPLVSYSRRTRIAAMAGTKWQYPLRTNNTSSVLLAVLGL